MRFNQFSYTAMPEAKMLEELASIGFQFDKTVSDKENFKTFLQLVLQNEGPFEQATRLLLASPELDLWSFLEGDSPLSDHIFYMVAFQLLGFVFHIDFEDVEKFRLDSQFPITYGDLLENLYHLLNTRRKDGNHLIDYLVAEGLIPESQDYHFFNGKSLATFSSHDAIREVVYVESRVDTDGDGLPDLVKVSIIRPKTAQKIPALMTASPYHQGVNDPACDRSLQNMNVNLTVKKPGKISYQEREMTFTEPKGEIPLKKQASQKLGHISSYSLNDYLLPRGFANIYVSGIGTRDSDGLMTSGDYRQIEAYKNVIDWLNGRVRAFTDTSRTSQIKADWANGKVATTGLSYLGTMSNGLATTGVEGLEVIIAEAGISSWYNYYRQNGLVKSPGGYPGEDFDSLTELTYSRNLRGGDYLRYNARYQAFLQELRKDIDCKTGDYNDFWHERNYLKNAHKVKAEVVFTHGSQDWNVQPIHVYEMFHALPKTIKKHLFFHHGEHVYMNNWQSIDFRESMNALLSQKLLRQPSDFALPTVIWQDNEKEQSWQVLEDFGSQDFLKIPLGQGEEMIQNAYPTAQHQAYSKNYKTFKEDLVKGEAQQICLDLGLSEDLLIQGPIRLQLRLKSSSNKGLISAQVLDFGPKKRLTSKPKLLSRQALDNGRYFALENLLELPFKDTPHRLLTKGHLNLQNRKSLLEVENVEPDEWMELSFELQPTIYQLRAGDQLRLLLYTTDFEHTIRDRTDYQLTLDLSQSRLEIPR